MNADSPPIRVLIAEDSPVARELLVAILQNTPGLQVVGTARNGVEAVRLAKRLKPDVITMDIHMPEMDGLEATRQIMAETPLPIVMVTASINKREQELTFNALQAGALSLIDKPGMYDAPEVIERLTNQVKLMAEVKVIRRWPKPAKPSTPPEPAGTSPLLIKNGATKIQLVAIAASTGGPGILAEILGHLPADFPVPVLIVQHITTGFGQGLADWLNQQTPLQVSVAQHGDKPQAGQVLIAPDDYHMVIDNISRLIALSQEPPHQGLRPAADYLFNSVARIYGNRAVGVVLSGMGSDGAEGLMAIRKTGAPTIVQNKETCVVFGMPAVAIELGAAEQILPSNQIAAAITALVQEV